MIFLTIGTQLPFDRLVKSIDEIAPDLPWPVFAQIGESDYRPREFDWVTTLEPRVFEEKFRAAHIIVSHAGVGTILTAQRLYKPIVLFPREARYGEHRNDHQLATCSQLEGRAGISIARNRDELKESIRTMEKVPPSCSADARDVFIKNLNQAISKLLTS
uniref:Glycosyltransferase 28, C-terminal domain n=1 Tax=Mycobacterium sp. (strain JLS) TaxID=164757 RepID=A0A5Q5CCA1_MYCSJ